MNKTIKLETGTQIKCSSIEEGIQVRAELEKLGYKAKHQIIKQGAFIVEVTDNADGREIAINTREEQVAWTT